MVFGSNISTFGVGIFYCFTMRDLDEKIIYPLTIFVTFSCGIYAIVKKTDNRDFLIVATSFIGSSLICNSARKV